MLGFAALSLTYPNEDMKKPGMGRDFSQWTRAETL